MAKTDMLKIALGMSSYGKKLKKKYGITPRENMLMAYHHQQPCTVPNLFVDAALIPAVPFIERYQGTDKGLDMFGVEWTYIESENSPMPTPGKYLLDDITRWREVVQFPDLDSIDWEAQSEKDLHIDVMATRKTGTYQALKNGKKVTDGGKLGFIICLNGPFERLHSLMGFENALMSLIVEPEECFAFFSAMVDYKIKYAEKLAKYYHPDVIEFHDDYGTTGRMFMSLETWRELLKPNLKRLIDAVHSMGILYEHHSCGYIEPLIPEFIEIGVDALDPLSPNCNTHLRELKDKYEKQLTFVGGCDNTRVFDRIGVTEEEIKAEYRRTLNELAPGGSFVAMPSGLTPAPTLPCLAEHFRMGVNFYDKAGAR